MGAQHTASEQHFIETQVIEKLSEAGVDSNGPLKALLVRDAEIESTGKLASLRVRDEHGRWVSVEERLADMKNDFRWKHHFPKGPAVVSANDMRATRDNFAEIASGRVRVER